MRHLKSCLQQQPNLYQVKVTAVADGNRFYVQLLSVENGICVNTQQRFADMQAKLNQDSSEAPRYQGEISPHYHISSAGQSLEEDKDLI